MMKKISLFLLVAFTLTSLAFKMAESQDQKYGYIGAQKCGMCHKKDDKGNQLKVWEESAHAKAYETLKTDAAKALAENATENETCLTCHATGYGSDPELNDKKFSIEEGVQCEACHGPGSEYKSMKVMKSLEESVKNGLVVWENEEQIQELCSTCHASDKKPEGHPDAEFNFAEQYAKIAHPYPEK